MSRKGFSVELQALRGLAALIVLVAHCASAIALPGGVGPLRFILNSGGAVVFFFVLSGFVLALSLQSRPATPQNTVSYYIRRGFRIYPALIVATILGTLICNHLALRADLSFGSDWLNIFYQQRIDGRKFVQAAAGLSAAANPPAWSIFVELICSAILPLLVFTTRGPASAMGRSADIRFISRWSAYRLCRRRLPNPFLRRGNDSAVGSSLRAGRCTRRRMGDASIAVLVCARVLHRPGGFPA